MHFKTASFILVAIFLANSALANEEIPKWDGYVEFEGRKGNHRDIIESDFFIPLNQSTNTLTFLNVRGMLDNKDSEEGNLGIGYRKILDKPYFGQNWIAGGYGFLDIRNSPNDNKFYQGTFGLEALSEDWDARTNIYIPENTEEDIDGTANVSANLSGTQLRIVGTDNLKERALPGIDAEIGYKLPVFETKIDEVRLYGGGFHFDASGYDNVSGPRGRLEMRWDNLPYLGEDSRLTLGAELQHDDVRDTTAFGIARLRIPFQTFKQRKTSRPNLSPLERRMTENIVRDVDIVSGEQGVGDRVNERATITINGTQVSNVTVLDATDNVPADITAAGAGATVIIDGSQGNINLAAQILPLANQTISGGGIAVTGTQSGLTTTFGTRPTLVDGGVNVALIDMNPANNTRVQNLDVIADATGNIFGVGATTNAVIDNVTTTGGNLSVGSLISTLTISNSTFSNSGSNGLILGAGTFSLNNVKIINAGANGLFLSSATNSTVNNVTVTNATSNSFQVLNSTMLSGTGNTSITPGALDCDDQGGNTGSFSVNGGACP